MLGVSVVSCFINDAATTEIDTLSYALALHDALPI
jgi:hypothetical protein